MSEEAAAATRRSRRGRSGGSGNGDANEEAAAAFEQLRDVGALRHLIGRYDLLCVGASFALCILLLVKFFGFDKSPRCNDVSLMRQNSNKQASILASCFFVVFIQTRFLCF